MSRPYVDPTPSGKSRRAEPAGQPFPDECRQKSTLFQRLAEPLWVPTGTDSVPTDSGAFRSQFCGREIVNAVLIVGGVAFEKAVHTAPHSARTPPERHAPASARAAKPSRTAFAPQGVLVSYELTNRAPGSRR